MLSLFSPFNKVNFSFARWKFKTLAASSDLVYRFQSSYVVLLPEIPEDKAENNPLLDDSYLPKMKELKLENCVMALGKKSLDYEAGVWAIEESLKENMEDCNFENVISKLEELDESLTTVWSVVKALYTIRNNDIPTANYLQIHERARKARVCKFQSKAIYDACKNIYKNSTNLSEAQKRVVRKYLLEYRLNGIELSEDDTEIFQVVLKKLESYKATYRKNLKEATEGFSYKILDKEVVEDFPADLLADMSLGASTSSGPWVVTLRPSIYDRFMEACPHKDLRWNAWNASIMRASHHTKGSRNNSKPIEEIRSARTRQANVLGFKTFADMSMETKMAGSVDNVVNVITSLFAKAKTKQTDEVESLKEFACDHGFKGDFGDSDVQYWRKKQLQFILDGSDVKCKEYFSFDFVWEQLLSLCSNLFDVNFERKSSSSLDSSVLWDNSVQFYDILDNKGNVVSSFFLDPYDRPGSKIKAQNASSWVMSLRKKSLMNSNPLVALVFNFSRPNQGGLPSLLSFDDMKILFKKFGHALQHLLTTVPYGQASGVTNIEWDAVDLCSNFMLNWLYEGPVLQKFTKHHQTGEPMEENMVNQLINQRQHLVAFDLCKELFISHYDLKLYSEDTYWPLIMNELWPIYMPFPATKYQSFPCWFSPIISDTWAAAYYSKMWSQMLAADAYRAFKECEPREVSQVGVRFRDTFLSLGGGCHPAEVFRKFRGRDPMPEALHTVLGIS